MTGSLTRATSQTAYVARFASAVTPRTGAAGRRRMPRVGALAGVLMVVCCLAWVAPALAATDTVTNTGDAGPGSLRDTIAAASSGDAIDFASGVTGTITLTTGQIGIAKDLTITGPGAGALTIDGNHASRIFNIDGGTGSISVSISGLTFAHGAEPTGFGGAINLGNASLTVSDSTFSANSSGGAGNSGRGGAIDATAGPLTVSDSTFSANTAGGSGGAGVQSGRGNGGAIAALNNGLTVTGSTFTANTAGGSGAAGVQSGGGFGGAIFISGTFPEVRTVTNSTFTGNTAGGNGGLGSASGLGQGGAIFTIRPTTLSNDTIDANSAGPASGSVGGGIWQSFSGSVTATGTIVSGNTNGAGSSSNCSVQTGSSSSSLEGPSASDTSCGFALTSADPLLGALADHGGPTQTQALGAGSPAVDRVPLASCPLSDQRGFARPDDSESSCDVGAYESGADTTAPSSTTTLNPAAPNVYDWYTAAVHVTVAASDPDDPVAQTRCVLDPLAVPASFDDLPATTCAYLGSGADVSADGAHRLYVASIDSNGDQEAVGSTAFNVDTTPPSAAIAAPDDNQSYVQGQVVGTLFACSEDEGGPGISSCVDSNAASGGAGALDTSTTGLHTYTVTATSVSGQSAAAQISYTVVPACSGLTIANQTPPAQSGTPGHSGSWSFTVSAKNCTGGSLHALKLQGGTAGWLSGASATTSPASTGAVTISKKSKNLAQTVSWSGFSLASGATASITVTVTGTVPKGSACGSSLPISGNWSATGRNASNSQVSSGPSTIATIAVSCP